MDIKYKLLRRLPDDLYLKLVFIIKMRRPLNLDDPRTFNEKLQWLKLNDRHLIYTDMVDKMKAKAFVAERIGERYIVPSLGVWNRFEEIDFETLPRNFVLKCTHDSGGLVVVRDKKKIDKSVIKNKIEASLRDNYYWVAREWPYKNVPPRIIAEEYLEGASERGLIDYKFYCFNGEPQFLYVSQGLENHSTALISFVNLDWSRAPYRRKDFAEFKTLPPKPQCLNEMLDVARTLSSGCKFLRVDLYEVNGRVYFSELTFTPCGGFMPFESIEQDIKMGELLKI